MEESDDKNQLRLVEFDPITYQVFYNFRWLLFGMNGISAIKQFSSFLHFINPTTVITCFQPPLFGTFRNQSSSVWSNDFPPLRDKSLKVGRGPHIAKNPKNRNVRIKSPGPGLEQKKQQEFLVRKNNISATCLYTYHLI